MTVLEMHHAVEQGLQKVASNSFDTFLPNRKGAVDAHQV